MRSNAIQLPRPRAQRPDSEGLGLFVRVGHNAHSGGAIGEAAPRNEPASADDGTFG